MGEAVTDVTLTSEQFVAAVRGHERFLAGAIDGHRAELARENFSGLRFRNLKLSGALLAGTNFSRCSLN